MFNYELETAQDKIFEIQKVVLNENIFEQETKEKIEDILYKMPKKKFKRYDQNIEEVIKILQNEFNLSEE